MEHTWMDGMHFVLVGVGMFMGAGITALCICIWEDAQLAKYRKFYEEHHERHHQDKDSIPPLIMSIAKTPDDYESHYSNGWIVLRQRVGKVLVSSLVAKVITEVKHERH